MNTLITDHWSAKRELPGIDCIAFADGNLIMLSIQSFYDPNNHESTISCSPLCDTTIESLLKYDNEIWTLVDAWTSIDYRGGKLYGGDGQMGNEGFIACSDANDDLQWAIFFSQTNPIKTLRIEDRALLAMNEHDEIRIEINLDTLIDIKIIKVK